MRLLGFLFVLALIVAAVGYFRGWFTVTTSHASGKSGMALTIDNDKLSDDASAITKGLPEGKTASEGAEAVPPRGEDQLEGVLTVVDVAARNITFVADSQTMVQHVATSVVITRKGANIGLDELEPNMRAKLLFDSPSESRKLLRIEITP